MSDNHSKHHPKDAFCGSAGPEELEHLESLIDGLSDDELNYLVKEGGIVFEGVNQPREILEGVVDELDRETFYRLYREVTEAREK